MSRTFSDTPLFTFSDYVKDARQQLGYCFSEGWGGACTVNATLALEHFQVCRKILMHLRLPTLMLVPHTRLGGSVVVGCRERICIRRIDV